jgi:hypothetical protein
MWPGNGDTDDDALATPQSIKTIFLASLQGARGISVITPSLDVL